MTRGKKILHRQQCSRIQYLYPTRYGKLATQSDKDYIQFKSGFTLLEERGFLEFYNNYQVFLPRLIPTASTIPARNISFNKQEKSLVEQRLPLFCLYH